MTSKFDTWEETECALVLLRAAIIHVQNTYRKDKHVDEWEPFLKELRVWGRQINERRVALNIARFKDNHDSKTS